MTDVIRIIAAVVDTQRLTLYKEDGSTVIIPQGDPRIHGLVEKVIPALEAAAFCDLTTKDFTAESSYLQAEKEMAGFATFLRVFKDTMEALVDKFTPSKEDSAQAVAPIEVGQVPAIPPQSAGQRAVAEIMQHATSSRSDSMAFSEPLGDHETVVAVLEDGSVIPGMEKLSTQFQGIALRLGSVEGVKNFLKRVSLVPRKHSVQDLLTFMEKGELPIADDGTVLVYKRLEATDKAGVFVDCHTGKVRQRVGSLVCMDESLVDPNRSQDCSNGLHVARRDYLSSFSGDVCVLAKLAPEDVIAVPSYDARKLRARAYHIVAQLTVEDARLVCSNKPMKDSVLLGNVAAGNHIGIIERVEITQHKGEGLIITPMIEANAPVLNQEKQSHSLDQVAEQQKKKSTVNAVDVAKKVGANQSSRQAKADAMLEAILDPEATGKAQLAKAKELVAFKKASKVSWEKLGITQQLADRVIAIAEDKVMPVAKKLKPAPVAKVKTPVFDPAAKVKAKKKAQTPRERIQALLTTGLTSVGTAQAVLDLKKQAKKSWDKLGVTPAQVVIINRLTGN